MHVGFSLGYQHPEDRTFPSLLPWDLVLCKVDSNLLKVQERKESINRLFNLSLSYKTLEKLPRDSSYASLPFRPSRTRSFSTSSSLPFLNGNQSHFWHLLFCLFVHYLHETIWWGWGPYDLPPHMHILVSIIFIKNCIFLYHLNIKYSGYQMTHSLCVIRQDLAHLCGLYGFYFLYLCFLN